MADESENGIDWGGMALSSIAPIYKGVSGLYQTWKGNNLFDKLRRPTYQTPDEIGQNTSVARSAFLDSRLPGQSAAENKVQANSSQAVTLAQQLGRSPAEIMAAITGANANANTGITNIATAAAERQKADQMNYQQALQLGADYKDKEFAYNKWMPYNQDRQYAQDLIGAGNKNIYGGLSDLTSGLAMTGGANALGSLFGKLFGKKGGAGSSGNYATSDYGTSAQNITGDTEGSFSMPQSNRYGF